MNIQNKIKRAELEKQLQALNTELEYQTNRKARTAQIKDFNEAALAVYDSAVARISALEQEKLQVTSQLTLIHAH